MITKIRNNRTAQIIYEFDNGVIISCIWGSGSYSDNHMNMKEFTPVPSEEHLIFDSETFECMVLEGEKMSKWLEKNYGCDPAAYVPVKEMPKIIAKADRITNEVVL